MVRPSRRCAGKTGTRWGFRSGAEAVAAPAAVSGERHPKCHWPLRWEGGWRCQGFGRETLAAVVTFGTAYLAVILLEPLADLGILAAAQAPAVRAPGPAVLYPAAPRRVVAA